MHYLDLIINQKKITYFKNLKKIFRKFLFLTLCIMSLPIVLIIRIIKPFFLIRFFPLVSDRIGHFAGNTELYLCERDAHVNRPEQRYFDIIFSGSNICNNQLFSMWKRIIPIAPFSLIFFSIIRVNNLFIGAHNHIAGNNSQLDRDVHNLLDIYPPHLTFTREEEIKGNIGLNELGIPNGAKFVCLFVRDNAYLNGSKYAYHNYRNADINNYILAAEELAERGYYVIRMGAKVNSIMKSKHKNIIDYATNGYRSEFMDIYLGSKCSFVISSCAGWDAVPYHLFRKPMVCTNACPIGRFTTFSSNVINLGKHHFSMLENRLLNLSEIFNFGVGFSLKSDDFTLNNIKLLENSPEEIRDVVIEMDDRLNNSWRTFESDSILEKRFLDLYSSHSNILSPYNRKPLHGEFKAKYSINFLRNNPDWLN